MQRKYSREMSPCYRPGPQVCAVALPGGLMSCPFPQLLDRTWRAVCIVCLCVVCVTVPLPPQYVTVHIIGCVTLWLCVYNHGACRRLRVLEAGGDGGGVLTTAWGLGRGPRNAWWGLELPPLLVEPLFVEQSCTHV